MPEMGDVFRPDVGLHADDMLLLLRCQLRRQGLELIHALHGQETTNTHGLASDVLALVVVEIEVRRRCHNHIVALACRLDAAFRAAPTHDDGRLGDVAFQDLVPTDDTPSTGLHHLGHAVHHIALQVVFGGEFVVFLDAQFLDFGLALGALFPTHLGAFVTTNVDIGRRKHIHHLVQHILHKQHGLLVTCTKHAFRHAPALPHLVGTARAAQMRIASQGSLHVARQIDFRNDVDVTLGGILDEVAELVLGIETTMTDGVVEVAIMPNDGTVTVGTNFSQFGILLDFDAPALVVAEVEMELVHVVHGQHVNVNLHRVQRDKMTTGVEVHATIGEIGPIADSAAGKLTTDVRELNVEILLWVSKETRDGDTLAEGLDAVEHASCIGTNHSDLLRGDVDFVGFGLVEILGDYFQHNAIRLALAF